MTLVLALLGVVGWWFSYELWRSNKELRETIEVIRYVRETELQIRFEAYREGWEAGQVSQAVVMLTATKEAE